MSRPKFEDIDSEMLYLELREEGMDEIAAEEFVRCIEDGVEGCYRLPGRCKGVEGEGKAGGGSK